MAFSQKEELHNKSLPFWYIRSGLIERLTYNWLVSAVANSSAFWLVQGSSATISRERVIPSTVRTVQGAARFGPVVNALSFATNNQH